MYLDWLQNLNRFCLRVSKTASTEYETSFSNTPENKTFAVCMIRCMKDVTHIAPAKIQVGRTVKLDNNKDESTANQNQLTKYTKNAHLTSRRSTNYIHSPTTLLIFLYSDKLGNGNHHASICRRSRNDTSDSTSREYSEATAVAINCCNQRQQETDLFQGFCYRDVKQKVK